MKFPDFPRLLAASKAIFRRNRNFVLHTIATLRMQLYHGRVTGKATTTILKRADVFLTFHRSH